MEAYFTFFFIDIKTTLIFLIFKFVYCALIIIIHNNFYNVKIITTLSIKKKKMHKLEC